MGIAQYLRLIIRADSGYFVGTLLDLLDAHKQGYLIKVKLKNLVVLMTGQQWTAIAGQPGSMWELPKTYFKNEPII